MGKKINIPMYIAGIILFSFVFKIAVADYIRTERAPASQIETWN